MNSKLKVGGKKKNKIYTYNKMDYKTKKGQQSIRKEFKIKRLNKVIEKAKEIGFKGETELGAYKYLNNILLDKDKVLLVVDAIYTPYFQGKNGKKTYTKPNTTTIKEKIDIKDLKEEYDKIKLKFESEIALLDNWKENYDYESADIEFSAPKIIKLDEGKKKLTIKKRDALNKVNYLDNKIWNKNRDMCYVDWIQYRFSPEQNNGRGYNVTKKLKLGKKDKLEDSDKAIQYYSTHDNDDCLIEDLDPNPNENGYTVEHIDTFCRNLELNLVLLDETKIIHSGLYKPKTKGGMPSIVAEINSGHFYPFMNNNKIKSWIVKASGNLLVVPKEKKQFSRDEINYTPYWKKTKYSKIYDVGSGEYRKASPLEYYLQLIHHELKILPSYPYNLKQKNGIITPLKINEKMYYASKMTNIDEEVLKYCKDNKIGYVGQGNISMTVDYLNKNEKLKQAASYFSPVIDQLLLQTSGIKNRTHYGLFDEEAEQLLKNNNDIVSYDINKCYRQAMINLEYLLQIDYNSGVRYFNDEDPFLGYAEIGLYYIKSDDMTLLHGANWYSDRMTNFALENEIIEKEDVLAYINCGGFNKGNPLEETIRQIENDFADYEVLQKTMINCIYGYMAKTESKSNNIFIDEDISRIYNDYAAHKGIQGKDVYINRHLINADQDWVKKIVANGLFNTEELLNENDNKVGDEKIRILYTYGESFTASHFNNYLPIAIQIQDEANIMLYEIYKKIKGGASQIIYRKTDFISIYAPKKTLPLSKKTGGYKKENNPKLPLPIQKTRYVDLIEYKKEWNDLHIKDSDNFNEIINEFIEKKGGLLLGRAGTGKSYVAKKGMEIMQEKNIKYVATAYTNKACIQLNGRTLHSLLKLKKENTELDLKGVRILDNTYDVIIIDEISMIGLELWKVLNQIKRLTNIIFILIGDYRQLPPIEDDETFNDMDWFDHSVVYDLVNGNRCELSIMKRYDISLWNSLELLWNDFNYKQFLKNVTLCSKEDLVNNFNICYYNKTRKEINRICMHLEKPYNALLIPYVKKPVTNKKNDPNKYHQDTYIYEGMPLFIFKQPKDEPFRKNELVKCIKCNDKTITVKNVNGDTLDIETDEFHTWLQAGYASTFYKCQGDTCEGIINIFDCDTLFGDFNMTDSKIKKSLYTAISRGRSLKNIKIRSGIRKNKK